MFATIIGLLSIFFATIFLYFRKTYKFWHKLNVPTTNATIPFGHFTHFKCPPLGVQLKHIYDHHKRNNKRFFGVFDFHAPIFVPIDPDLIKDVMLKSFPQFNDRGFYHNQKDQPISANLFSLGGENWKRLRVNITPTFTSGKLKLMVPILLESRKPLLKHLEYCVDNHVVIDMKSLIGKLTIDTIGRIAFGLKCDSFEDPDSEFVQYAKKTFAIPAWRQVRNMFAMYFPKWARKLHIVPLDEGVATFFTRIVAETIKYRKENRVETRDFLQLLMKLLDENVIDFKELSAMAFVFFVAGYDTTASTITFAMFELAKDQNVQMKAREEIRTVLKKDKEITYEVLSTMTYLQQVIDECLRKYPPLAIISRKSSANYIVPGTDIELPENSFIWIPVYSIHHDPLIYKDPFTFDPERFSRENRESESSKNRGQFSHIPFGEGPRICIGQRLALMQTKLALVTLLKDYTFSLNAKTSPDIQFGFTFLLSPTEKLLFDIKKCN